MSAFQVSSSHIASILAAWAAIGVRAPSALGFVPSDADTWVPTFDKLATVNAASVGYRYREECAPVPAPARLLTFPAPDRMTAIKAIDCLVYQSCERPDWEGCAVDVALQRVKAALVASLPGYDAAPWSIA